jgi:hypothetical protein
VAQANAGRWASRPRADPRRRLDRARLGAGLGRFDLILANPPYVEEAAPLDPGVRDFEPASALFAGPTAWPTMPCWCRNCLICWRRAGSPWWRSAGSRAPPWPAWRRPWAFRAGSSRSCRARQGCGNHVLSQHFAWQGAGDH